jgi:hypothetical protein
VGAESFESRNKGEVEVGDEFLLFNETVSSLCPVGFMRTITTEGEHFSAGWGEFDVDDDEEVEFDRRRFNMGGTE